MTTEPETIPADVLELAKEAHANFARSSVTDNLTTIIARAIMTDRTSRAPVGGAGWRPIKTAPKDGTRFLALEGNRHFDCWWRDFGYGEQCWMDEADTEPDPTHWLPLPAAPAAPGTHPAPSSPDAEMVKRETFQSCGEWADATFGPATVLRRLERAEEELEEAKTAEPNKVMEEIADVVICLAAAAHSFGGDLQVAIDAKMAINRKREWNVRGDGTGYHVSSSDAVAPPLSKHGVDW